MVPKTQSSSSSITFVCLETGSLYPAMAVLDLWGLKLPEIHLLLTPVLKLKMDTTNSGFATLLNSFSNLQVTSIDYLTGKKKNRIIPINLCVTSFGVTGHWTILEYPIGYNHAHYSGKGNSVHMGKILKNLL